MTIQIVDLPVTAYRVRPPHGPAQLDAISFEVENAAAVFQIGTAKITLNLADKLSGPSGLTHVRIAITVPGAEILSSQTEPSIPSIEQTTSEGEAVWRVAKLLSSAPGPVYSFIATFKPLVAGTLRIAFTGRAAEIAGTRESVWDHLVDGAAQP